MTISKVFITLIGTLFILVASPLAMDARFASSGLISCAGWDSVKDYRLRETYMNLIRARQMPECAKMLSVEDCPGFRPTPDAEILKAMEVTFKCSGLCYNPSGFYKHSKPSASNASGKPIILADVKATVVSSPHVPEADRIHASQQHLPLPPQPRGGGRLALTIWRRMVDAAGDDVELDRELRNSLEPSEPPAKGASLIAIPEPTDAKNTDAENKAASSRVRSRSDTALLFQAAVGSIRAGEFNLKPSSPPVDVNSTRMEYPPTLFSKSNFESTCDGMAARYIHHTASTFADQLFYEGIFLIGGALCVSLLNLLHRSKIGDIRIWRRARASA